MRRQQFTKSNIEAVRAKMQVALNKVAEECGVSFDVGSCTYSPQTCNFKVKVSNIVDGEVKKQEVEDWNLYAEGYGFKKEDLGREFVGYNGHKCKITGLLPSRRKYPIQYYDLALRKTYITTARQVKQALGIKDHSFDLTQA